jgi:bifunctional N-acetylglucosamine-1-phosphate-uridyltransferase/glucosamine-1-phosphate-acetyltransferase GlmU-like protein
VVNYRAEEVRRATEGRGIYFISQPETNGTGGALLAARDFLESVDADYVVITMGDIPLIRAATYHKLLDLLQGCDLCLLAFECKERAQYGMIETETGRITGIVEWKYWKDFPSERQARLRYCNAGVYAAKKAGLLGYMDRMEKRPHEVRKQKDGELVTIKEYFLTDLAEMMSADGLPVGMTVATEDEVTGVDNPEALESVQKLYTGLAGSQT